MEFSGACAGCGETAYVKLLTQMFGDRMLAKKCYRMFLYSAMEALPITNQNGCGTSWGKFSLEDNAEFAVEC